MPISTTQRQAEIVGAALSVISRDGIGALTTRSLATELGLSEPIIYRYFENKIQILAAVLDFIEERARAHIAGIMSKEATALGRIEELYLQTFRSFEKRPALTTVIFSEEYFNDEALLSSKVSAIISTTEDAIIRLLRTGIQEGEIRCTIPVEHLAVIIMGTMRFLVVRWRLSNRSSDLVAVAATYFISFHTLITGSTT
jgi:AcrR family transcriptional regulator